LFQKTERFRVNEGNWEKKKHAQGSTEEKNSAQKRPLKGTEEIFSTPKKRPKKGDGRKKKRPN